MQSLFVMILYQLEDLQAQLEEAKEDKKRIATTLESVMLSHNELQEALEQLQVDLGRKDHELLGYKQDESVDSNPFI